MATPDYFGTNALTSAATRAGTARGYTDLGYAPPSRSVGPAATPEDYFSPVPDDYGVPPASGRAPRAAAVVDPFDAQFKQAKAARQHLLDQEALYAHRLKDFDATDGAELKMSKNPLTGQRYAAGFRDETRPLLDAQGKLLETLGGNAGTAALKAPTTPRERALRQTRQRIADELARVQRARMDYDASTYAPMTARRAARDSAPDVSSASSLLSSGGSNVQNLDFLSGLNQDANTRQSLGINQRGSVGAGNFTQPTGDESTLSPPLSSEEQPYDPASHDEQPRDYFGEDSATLLQQQTGVQPTPTDQQRFAQAGVLDRLKLIGSKLFGSGEGIRTPESEVSVPAGIPIGFGDAGTKGQLFDVPATEGDGVVSGIARAGNKFTASLLTPENAAIAAATGGLGELAAAGGVIGKAAQLGKTAALGGFAADMASQVPQGIKDAYAVYTDPNSTAAQKAEAIATPGLTAFMAALAAHGAVGEARRIGDIGEMRAPTISPETEPSTGELTDALREPSATRVLQSTPEGVGEGWGQRGGVEPSQQRTLPAEEITAPIAASQAEAPAEGLSGGSEVIPKDPFYKAPIPPEWQITVQEPQGDIPGFQQVDKIGPDGDSQGSVSLDELRAEGYAVPDVSHLKQGQYRFGELPENPNAAEPTQPPTPGEPAPAVPANEPTPAAEPVAEPASLSSETQTPETAQLGENQNGPDSSKRMDAPNVEPQRGLDSDVSERPRTGEPANGGPDSNSSVEQRSGGESPSERLLPGEGRSAPADATGTGDASSPLTDESVASTPQGDAVGIKNASVEEQRKAQGLEPAELRRGITNQDALDSAMAERARDPAAGQKLIEDYEANPRALTGEENALLATELNRIRVERNAAKAEADTALVAGDQAGIEAAQQRIAKLREEFNRAGAVADATGTRQSDALRTRQMMLNEDYSLAELERQQTIANRGEPITPKQQQEIETLHADYQAKLKALEDVSSKHQERIATLEAERAVQDILQKTAPERREAIARAPAGKVRRFISEHAAAAEARIMERRRSGKIYSGIDPTELKDYAYVAAELLAKGVDAAAELVRRFGEQIHPHIKDILKEAENVAREATVGERDTAGERTSTIGALKERAAEGLSVADVSRYVRKVAEQHVREGITAREPLVDAVHRTVKEAFPDATRREVADAMSGYGKFSELSKDPVAVTLRDITGQLQNLSKLEDMQAGKAPSKTGVERRTPSGEERRLIQQVNEAKKKGGFTVQDPERQLKTAQDAIKTRLRNEIEDLDFQIATGKKTVKSRTAPEYDAEAKALRDRRDELKKIYDEKFPKAELTDAERNQRAIQAADAQIAELERQIKTGEVGTGLAEPKPAPSPELAARQAKLSALRAERDVLRDTDELISRQRSDAALEKEAQTLREQIAAKEAKIATGDVEPAKRMLDRPADPRIEQLKQQRDATTKRLAEARKAKNEAASGYQTRELKRLNEAIAERQAKLDAGDLSSNARPAAQNRPLPPDLEAAKQKLEAINRQIADARNAAKPRKTPEEIQLSAYRASLERRRAALLEREARQARGDFSAPPKRQPIELPPDLQTAKADLERAKQALDERQKAEELKNRPAWQKGFDLVSKWTRGAVLSSPVTLAKLLSASVNQVALHPLDEMAGSVYSKAFPKLSGKAQIEGGGFSGKATAKSIAAGLIKGWGDLKDTLSKSKGNRSELDALYGKGHAAPEALEFFGLLHGAEKAPLKRYAFTYALEKQIAYAQAHGIDVTSPAAQVRMGAEAYKYANRAIFQEDNWVSNAFNRGLTSLAEPSKETGRIPVAKKLAETAVRVSLPVAKVGTNIALQSFERLFGSIKGGAEVARAYAKGIETLKPDEAELIMRHLKRGTPGLALATAAYFMPNVIPQVFGGFYDKTDKRDKRDVAPGEMASPVALPKFVSKTGNIPAYLLHNPAINAAHFYSTAARAGIPHALLGLAEELPYIKEAKDVVGATEPGRGANYLGGVVNSMNPQLVQFAARQMDRNSEGDVTTRKPNGFVQTVEQGIPGLRGNVPQKTYVSPAVEGAVNRLGIDIPVPARPKIGPPNKKVPVSDDVYLRYRQESDRALNQMLLQNLPTLRGMSKEQADRRVKELATQAHAQAHAVLPVQR